jgi:hypothetical protein
MSALKVLIACEFSGLVRNAFIDAGCQVTSCDLLPGERIREPLHHYQGCVFDLLGQQWDIMVGFPPCNALASSGARWFKQKRADGRQQQGIDFFMALANADVPMIALENPIGIMSTKWRKPDQIVQPWFFGDEATKTTCLWLKGLPKLQPTKIVGKGERHVTKSGRSLPKWYNLPPSSNRSKIRSTTFPGFASAMGSQWGRLSKNGY